MRRTFFNLVQIQGLLTKNGLMCNQIVSIGHLLLGNFTGSLIGFVAFAITARALGPLDYGVLAMLFAYTRAIERLVTFQSWQPLIKYASELDASVDIKDLKSLMKFGLLLDVGGALASYVVAVTLAFALHYLMDWSNETLRLTVLYSTVLLFNLSGVPTAVLRLAGRFRLLGYSQVVGAVIRVAFCAAAYAMGGDLFSFVLGWAVLQVWSSLLMVFLAAREMRRQGLVGILGVPLAGITARFPGLWRFAWSANLALTIRSSAHELDTLLVGWLADPASAGLYHIAKRVGRLAVQVGAQVQAVIFPDVSRLWAEGELTRFRNAVWHVEVILGVFGVAVFLFFLVAAEPLLELVAGPEFGAAAQLLKVQMLAVITALSGISVRLALLAMGRSHQVLVVVASSTIAFHLTAISLIPQIGAMGANVAHLVMGIVWFGGLTWLYRRALAQERLVPTSQSLPAPHEEVSSQGGA